MCLFSNTRQKQTASAKTVQLISVEDLKSQGHIECTPFGTLPSHSICGQQFKQNTEGTGRNSRQAKLCCLCASRFWNQLVQSPKPPCSAHALWSRASPRCPASLPAPRTHAPPRGAPTSAPLSPADRALSAVSSWDRPVILSWGCPLLVLCI